MGGVLHGDSVGIPGGLESQGDEWGREMWLEDTWQQTLLFTEHQLTAGELSEATGSLNHPFNKHWIAKKFYLSFHCICKEKEGVHCGISLFLRIRKYCR